MEGTKDHEKSTYTAHCCACWKADAGYAVEQNKAQYNHENLANVISAAGLLLTAEYRGAGDRPTRACDEAEKFLEQVFRKATGEVSAKGLSLPEFLGGKYG